MEGEGRYARLCVPNGIPLDGGFYKAGEEIIGAIGVSDASDEDDGDIGRIGAPPDHNQVPTQICLDEPTKDLPMAESKRIAIIGLGSMGMAMLCVHSAVTLLSKTVPSRYLAICQQATQPYDGYCTAAGRSAKTGSRYHF